MWSGERKLGADGRLPAVGKTPSIRQKRNVDQQHWHPAFGARRDPDFDPAERSFYYARVIDPRRRWTAYEAVRFASPCPPGSHDGYGAGLHLAHLGHAMTSAGRYAGALIATVAVAAAPAAGACGYHDPTTVSRGMLNWVYPNAPLCANGRWQAEDAVSCGTRREAGLGHVRLPAHIGSAAKLRRAQGMLLTR